MQENEFKIGDVVRLKSGGPTMTVNKIWEDSEYRIGCVWFDDSNKQSVASFHPETLKLASTSKNHSF